MSAAEDSPRPKTAAARVTKNGSWDRGEAPMKVVNRARPVSSPEPRDESGFPAVDLATVGKYATLAGSKLSSMAGSSSQESASSKALGATGEGLRNAGVGAGIGASIGSVIPGIGTVIGGAIGAVGGAIVGVIHYLFGSSKTAAPELQPYKRAMLKQGMEIYKTRHLPGAFQDAILCIYNPASYEHLRAQGRLPSQIEAELLKKRAYAAHARTIEQSHGVRLRRQLLHLPPDFRILVGVGAITGHSHDLNVAVCRALADRAGSVSPAVAASPAPPATPEPLEPGAPYNLAPQGGDPQSPDDPRPALPDTANEAGDAQVSPVRRGSPVIMRSVVDVFDAGDAVFAWRPINVSFKRHPHDASAQTLLGTFWVFVDALKDLATGLRWPCSAAETQIIADRILVAPGHLPQWWDSFRGEELPSLMMTTRLMCARWLNARDAHQIIAPHPDSTSDLLIAGSTRMNRAIDADLVSFKKPDSSPWVADPGKIWALHRRLFDGTAETVNYGWHVDPVLTAVPGHLSPNAAIPGVSLLQSAGGMHNVDHIDYSQILLLVAPWCMVAPLGQDRMVPMRTADVYQSRELAGLVTDDALPLAQVRQPFDPNHLYAARQGFWADQERIYEDKRQRGLGIYDVLPRGDTGGGRTRIYQPTDISLAPPRTNGAQILTNAPSPRDLSASDQWSKR